MEQYRRDASSRTVSHFFRGMALVAAAAALVLVGFGAGVATMWVLGPNLRQVAAGVLPSIPETVETSDQVGFGLLSDIRNILSKEFVDPEAIDAQKMTHGAAAGLVASLGDPHTVFVEPLRAAIMDEDMRGSFEGIGATVEMVDGQLIIVKPLPGSPALKAGLRSGDIILAANDESLEGKTILEAISLIRGPRKTVVRLLVQRQGMPEPFVVPVTRDKVELPIIESRRLEGNVAYLRLKEFNAISPKRVHSALDELLDQETAGLVLDLRGNPGGYLDMTVDIASEFLPEGTLILTERQRDHEPKEYRVKRAGIATTVPLVVLVNGASASASEILAAAMRDNHRATLIGEQTFGKGSVQSTHRLSDGSGLRVTIAKWYPPSGQNLDHGGIEPNIKVTVSQEDLIAERDPQLERAVAYLLNGE